MTNIAWVQKLDGLTGRIAEVKDAYETYYAEVGDMTAEQVEDAFVATYDFNDDGSPAALRAEIQIDIRSRGQSGL